MGDYLIPANSKKGQLMFGIFRPIDLAILICGGVITFVMLFVVPGQSISALVMKLLPLTICVLLIVPVPYYHNVLVFIEEVIIYLMEQKQFSWKGWCARSEYGSEQK